jgi:hypothetical protein
MGAFDAMDQAMIVFFWVLMMLAMVIIVYDESRRD